jgi:protein-S-isoprenylcysteine O-methyltransferase Ste14
MQKWLRHIIGYTIGGTIFLMLIPYGLYRLSQVDPISQHIRIFYSVSIKNIFSFFFFLVGALFMVWSNIFLLKAGKGGPADGLGIAISPRTRKLVISGPYKYSRNPMVFGACSLYTSLVLFLHSLTGLACIALLLLLVIPYLKIFEEKRLLRDFGNNYLHYKKHVSMIFPLKKYNK